jgi:hypothetical protein
MSKNPILNALAAAAYIVLVGSGLYFTAGHDNEVMPFFGPIAFISLFTFSAAMMGYCLLLQPIRMYIDGDKSRAVKLLGQTLIAFGSLTAIFLIIAYLSVKF